MLDLPRPALLVTPPIAPTAVVMTGVTASATGPEIGAAKIGAILVGVDALVAAAADPDDVVDAAAAAVC